MSLTFVDLANEALDLLGASPIQSLTDTSAEARIVARALPRVLDRVLRSYPWNAVITRLDLSGQPTGEDDPLGHVFVLPEAVLRVLDVWPEGAGWRVETRAVSPGSSGDSPSGETWQRVIRTDTAADAPLRVRVVRRPDDPAGLDPLLSSLVAAELAVALAAKLTENTSRMATLMDFAARLRRDAITADALESGGESILHDGLSGGLGGRF